MCGFVAQAFQNCHAPLEAPDAYVEKYPEDWRDDRRWYAGMVAYWVRASTRSFITSALRVQTWNFCAAG